MLRRYDKVLCSYQIYDFESPHDPIPAGTELTVRQVDTDGFGTRACLVSADGDRLAWVAERCLAQIFKPSVIKQVVIPVGETCAPEHLERPVCPHCGR